MFKLKKISLSRIEDELDRRFEIFLEWVDKKRIPLLTTGFIHLALVIIAVNAVFSFRTLQPEEIETITFADIERLDRELQKEEESEQTMEVPAEEFTHHASNLTATREMAELRQRLTSLDQVEEITRHYDDQGNEISVDLFSEEAKKRQLPPQTSSTKETLPEEQSIEKEIYTGASTITFELEGRYELQVPNPVYTCPSGGLVVVEIKVSRSGAVTAVQIDRARTQTSDQCLWDAALTYARRARFNVSSSAPDPQRGVISYLFQHH